MHTLILPRVSPRLVFSIHVIPIMFIAVLAMCPPAPAHAGLLQWEDVGVYGGTVRRGGLANHPSDPGHIVGVFSNRAYQSRDGGLTWTRAEQATEGLGNFSVHFDPQNPNVIYAGKNVTHDDGQTWSVIADIPGSVLGVDSADSNILYALPDDGESSQPLYRTSDGGATWTPLQPADLTVAWAKLMAIDPVSPNIIYAWIGASRTDGPFWIYKSTDRGDNWQRLSIESHHNYYCRLVIDPHQHNRILALKGIEAGIHLSEDGGETWIPVHTLYFAILFADPFMEGRFYAMNNYQLYRSDDGGWNWTPGAGRVPTRPDAAAVTGPGHVLLGMDDGVGVMRSEDGGITWAVSSTGIRCVDVIAIDIDPADENVIHVAMEIGLRRSTDGGTSWAQVGATNYGFRVLERDLSTTHTLWSTTTSGEVQNSTDNGEHWTLRRQVAANRPMGLYVNPIDGQTIIVGGGWETGPTHFAVSRDGGQIFTDSTAGNYGQVRCMDWGLVDGQPVIYAACNWDAGAPGLDPECGLIKSTDEGRTWTTLDLLSRFSYHQLAVDRQNGNRLYIANGLTNRLSRSDDGGQTWIDVTPTDSQGNPVVYYDDLELDAQDSDHLFSSGGDAIYETTDGGATWNLLDHDLGWVSEIHYLPSPLFPAPPMGTSNHQITARRGVLFASVNGSFAKADLPRGKSNAAQPWACYE